MRQVIVFNNKNWPLPAPRVPDYLCFTAKAANSTVLITQVGTPLLADDFEISTDAKNWAAYTTGTTLTLSNIGDKIYMRGNNTTMNEGSAWKKILCVGNIKLSGDLRSLLSKQNFSTLDTLVDRAFQNLFYENTTTTGNTGITDASEIKLLAKTIGLASYCNLFKRCKNMVYGPASIDAENFTGNESCVQMFLECTSLVESPVLKGKILSTQCYLSMFEGCSSLNKITTYANNISANNCLLNWVKNVSATGDFYNLGGVNYSSGISGIPTGWTVHTSL